MHGLEHFASVPSAKARERLQNTHYEPPAHLQAFEDLAVPNVAPQHDYQDIAQMRWVPGHLHPRLHPAGQLHAFAPNGPIGFCVLEHEASIRSHFSHSGWEH